MDDETDDQPQSAEWPDLSAEETLARNRARAASLSSQHQDPDARILRIDAQLELMGDRVNTIESSLAATPEIPSDVTKRLVSLERHVAGVRDRFQTFSEQLSSVTTTAGGDHSAVSQEIERLASQVTTALSNVDQLTRVVEETRGSYDVVHNNVNAEFASYGSKIENVERAIRELGLRFDESSQTIQSDSVASNQILGETVEALSKRVDARSHAQAQNAVAIQSLEDRTLRIEQGHDNYLKKVVEHVNLAHRRLTQSSSELTTLQARINADQAQSAEKRAELSEGLDSHANDIRSLLTTIDEVTTSIDSRLGEQDGLIQKHSEILETATVLLSKHDEITSGHKEALEAVTQRVDGHDEGLTVALESIEAALLSSQKSDRALGAATEQITALDERLQLHDGAFDNVNEKIERVDALTERIQSHDEQIETHGEQIAAVNDWVTVVDRRILDIDEHTKTSDTQIEAVNDWVTSLDGRLNQTVERFDALNIEQTVDEALVGRLTEFGPIIGNHTTQIEAVNDWQTDADDRIVEIEKRTSDLEELTSSAKEKLEELQEIEEKAEARVAAQQAFPVEEVIQLREDPGAVSPTMDTQSQQIEALNDWVVEVDRRVTELRGHESTAEEKFEALDDWSASLDGRVVDIQTSIDTVQTQMEAVDEWSISADIRIEELQRITADSARRIEDVDAALNQRIDAAAAETIAQLGDLASAADEQINEVDSKTAVLQQDIDEIHRRIAATNTDLELVRTSGFAGGERAQAAEGRTEALEAHSAEMNEQLARAQHSLSELTTEIALVRKRFDENDNLTTRVELIAGATEELQVTTNELQATTTELQSTTKNAISRAAATDQSGASDASVSELRDSVREWIESVEQAAADATSELRDFIVYRIDSAEDRIDRRVADMESSGAGGERLEQIERAVGSAEERAKDAQASSENLRLVQSDLVQALRGELAAQAARITRLETLLSQR